MHTSLVLDCLLRDYRNSRAIRDAEAAIIAHTPWPVFDAELEPLSTSKVLRADKSEDDNSDVEVSSDEQQEHLSLFDDDSEAVESEPVEDFEGDGSIAALKKAANKAAVNKAFADKRAGSLDMDGFCATIRPFVAKKITGRLYDSPGGIGNVEDHVQEVVIYVWQHLSDFSGEPKAFYTWLNRICYTTATKGFNEGKESRDKFEQVTVKYEDGSIGDNLNMYSDGRKRNGQPIIGPAQPQYAKKLPDFIQGTDLMICDLIREGYDYKRIAKFCHITEKAVRERVAKMKRKNLAMKKTPIQ